MPTPLPVVIDTDPGVDDALALLLAAACPRLDVLAVTTVAGNIGIDRATENARRIVAVAWDGKPAPPIHRGSAGSDDTAEHVHGADGLGGAAALTGPDGAALYPPSAHVAPEDAAETILSLADRRPGAVTLVTLGPLTNLADAIRRNRMMAARLKEVVVMGGAFREPGNVSPVAEFNVWADPEAAQVVCDSGLPLRWVPLDVTHRCLLREEHLADLPDTPRARLARHATEFYMRHHLETHGERACFLHDPLAVAAAAWPELLQAEPLHVNVETQGRFTRGMTLADFRPAWYHPHTRPNSQVCLQVDESAFLSRFLECLRS